MDKFLSISEKTQLPAMVIDEKTIKLFYVEDPSVGLFSLDRTGLQIFTC